MLTTKKEFYQDFSFWFLILSNIATLGFALYEGWSIGDVVWIYYIQSVFIGVFTFLKILTISKFTYQKKHRSLPIPGAFFFITKFFMAGFFAIHYGIFHLVYFVFLMGLYPPTQWLGLLIASAMFFANHLYSYLHFFSKERKKDVSLMFSLPYARIVPMHLTIIFGAFWLGLDYGRPLTICFFMVLKTIADCTMHLKKHELE